MLPIIFAVAGATGVASHLGIFIRGEWHMKAPYVVMTYATLASLGLWVEARILRASSPVENVLVATTGHFCGLFMSMVVYRLLFHQLRSFPGPRIASASKLWHVYQNLNSRNYELLDSLSQQYGDFVRIGK